MDSQLRVSVFKVLVGYWSRYRVQFAWLGRYMHLNASWVSGRLEHLEAGEGKLRQDKISLETRWDSSLWDGPGRRHSEKDVLRLVSMLSNRIG